MSLFDSKDPLSKGKQQLMYGDSCQELLRKHDAGTFLVAAAQIAADEGKAEEGVLAEEVGSNVDGLEGMMRVGGAMGEVTSPSAAFALKKQHQGQHLEARESLVLSHRKAPSQKVLRSTAMSLLTKSGLMAAKSLPIGKNFQGNMAETFLEVLQPCL